MPGYERGRLPGKVAEMIRNFAIDEGLSPAAVTMFNTPLEGVKDALANALEGDCLVLLALTQRNEVLATVQKFVAD
jgi:hypothetical protein